MTADFCTGTRLPRRAWTARRAISTGAVREAAARGLRIGALADEFNVDRLYMAEFCARHRIEVAIDKRRCV